MTLKKLKKKNARKKSHNSKKSNNYSYRNSFNPVDYVEHEYVPVDPDELIKTPVDEYLKLTMKAKLSKDKTLTGIINGDISSVDDQRLDQLVTALLVINYHLERADSNRIFYVSNTAIQSPGMNVNVLGVDLIPNNYLEMAIWTEAGFVYYLSSRDERYRGTSLRIPSYMIKLSDEIKAFFRTIIAEYKRAEHL